MASSSGGPELITFVIGVAVLLVVLYISVLILGIILSLGAAFGSGVSIYNYGLSVKRNLSLEKPSP